MFPQYGVEYTAFARSSSLLYNALEAPGVSIYVLGKVWSENNAILRSIYAIRKDLNNLIKEVTYLSLLHYVT